jgi:tetratricopeptide (TPR) repeat protein
MGAWWLATRVPTLTRHVQSDTMMDLRRACLSDRLTELSALLTTLEAEPVTEPRVEQLQRIFPEVEASDDEKALLALVGPPSSPSQRALVTQVRAELATVSALRLMGEQAAAQQRLPAVLGAALDAGYRPLEADALVEAGQVALDADDFELSSERLQQALVSAEAGGHVRAAARGWIVRTLLDGVKRGKVADGHHAAKMAAAASERFGSRGARDQPRHPVVRRAGGEAHEAALAKYREVGASPLVLSQALNAVGAQTRWLGDIDAAVKWHQQALDLVTSRYSATHPAAAPVMINLGNVYLEAGKLKEAVEWYEKAQAVLLASYGPDSLELASARSNLGGTLLRQGKLEQAEPMLRASLTSITTRLGEDASARLAPMNNLAILLRYSGKTDEALTLLEGALRISRKTYGDVNEQVANALINLGDVQLARRDFAASVKSYEEAITVTEKTAGPEHPNLGDCWGGLAFPLLEQGAWARALEATE